MINLLPWRSAARKRRLRRWVMLSIIGCLAVNGSMMGWYCWLQARGIHDAQLQGHRHHLVSLQHQLKEKQRQQTEDSQTRLFEKQWQYYQHRQQLFGRLIKSLSVWVTAPNIVNELNDNGEHVVLTIQCNSVADCLALKKEAMQQLKEWEVHTQSLHGIQSKRCEWEMEIKLTRITNVHPKNGKLE